MIKKNKIIRVNETEFELEDWTIYQHLIEIDNVPTIEGFQKIYYWENFFNEYQREIDKY